MADSITPLLLKNGGPDKNMCSLNSVLQSLQNIPEFCTELLGWKNTSAIIDELIKIICQRNQTAPISALELRRLLALATNQPLNSGVQNDTIELFSYILDHTPSRLFCFDIRYEYWFNIDENPSACPSCNMLPTSMSLSDKLLKISLPSAGSFNLEDLIKKHFAVQDQHDHRQCIQCQEANPSSPSYSVKEQCKILNYPEYLLIQILRMNFVGGRTVKNCSPILSKSENILVDDCFYNLIGTISHLGTAEAGHNRAYVKKEQIWYCCENSYYPFEELPIDCEQEQNYCLLL